MSPLERTRRKVANLYRQSQIGSGVLQRKWRPASAEGHPKIQPASHPGKTGIRSRRAQYLPALPHHAAKTSECPDALLHFWSGHAQTHVSERYTKLLRQRDFRLDWTEKIGPGFELPKAPISNLSNLIEFRRVG